MGANITLCGPPHLIPKGIGELGVSVNSNIDEVIEWADALNILQTHFRNFSSHGE